MYVSTGMYCDCDKEKLASSTVAIVFQAAPAASIDPDPGPEYILAELISGANAAKSSMTPSPEVSYPAAGGRGMTTGRNPYLGMARRSRLPVPPIGPATPPGPPAAGAPDVPMSLRPLTGVAV